ncbi:Zinc finger protein 862 [Frankliniella fusca]|uniref:Zinc finger protein 862 n=1 Tax=Frankliniella fusca TaxID=407009 RepID=A0AAE1LUA1_9NEOP|nr:Zinc finger protein 862 [Frankliniella fusca]
MSEDFNNILVKLEIPVKTILKHCPSRWLSICDPGKRLLEQWAAYNEYFLKFLPSKNSTSDLSKLARYTRIRSFLKDPTMTAQITFAIESAELFESFSKCFQKTDPMIHMLYPEILRLVKILAGRVCKKQVVENIISESNPFSPDNLVFVKDILCGDLTEKELAKPCLNEIDVLTFRKSAQDFFIQSAKHLLDKSILRSSILKHFRCLDPSLLKGNAILRSAERVARALPINVSVTRFLDEFKLLQTEDLPAWNPETGRVDHFWRKVFQIKSVDNEAKYPLVSKVFKAALAVSHGSSDVERGFSESGNVLTDDKTRMNERTLNAKLNIKSGLNFYQNKPQLVPMSKDLLLSGRLAHSKYKEYLEAERKKEDEAKRRKEEAEEDVRKRAEFMKSQNKMRRSIADMESKVKELKRAEKEETKASEQLLSEGQKKLEKALKNKDLEGARVAFGMISGAQNMKKIKTSDELKSLATKLDKKKSTLLSNFFQREKGTASSSVMETQGSDIDDDFDL